MLTKSSSTREDRERKALTLREAETLLSGTHALLGWATACSVPEPWELLQPQEQPHLVMHVLGSPCQRHMQNPAASPAREIWETDLGS